MSPLSPLTLPWATLRLAGRFALPLALWFTVGEALRYLIFLGGYHYGLHNSVIPIIALSLTVMVVLSVTVAMLHSIKDGLHVVKNRDLDESETPWAAQDDESVLDALTRALFPFMIFYLAWGWFKNDAQSFVQAAAGRAGAQGGISGQIEGMKIIIALQDHIYVAIICTVAFFLLKFVAERLLEPRMPRVGAITMAFCEVNWTLFGVFTVDQVRGWFWDWFNSLLVWTWVGDYTGPVLGWLGTLWPLFKDAVLGGLVWLVIAGVVLGVDAAEEVALGEGRIGRRVLTASGLHKPRTPHEVLTRELREKWFPTIHGFRLVAKGGLLPFGVFCAMLAGLKGLALFAERQAYVVLGPHEVGWWNPRLGTVHFGVELVHQGLRVCLLAAAFNLVVARVSARNAAPATVSYSGGRPGPAGPPVPQS